MTMGDSVYPSGSLAVAGQVELGWAAPTVYQPVSIPVGSLVEVSVVVGPVLAGEVGVVVERLGAVGNRSALCRVATGRGTVELPEYVLKLLSVMPWE